MSIEAIAEGRETAQGVTKKDALNMFSRTIATQAVRMMNAGVDPKEFIMMYIDHAAGLLALIEPSPERHKRVRETMEVLRRETLKKVHKRQEAARPKAANG